MPEFGWPITRSANFIRLYKKTNNYILPESRTIPKDRTQGVLVMSKCINKNCLEKQYVTIEQAYTEKKC